MTESYHKNEKQASQFQTEFSYEQNIFGVSISVGI